MQTVTKSAYARMIGVSPGRVSQYISEGKLHGDALQGEGSRALIVVETANTQLGRSVDMVQSFVQSRPGADPPSQPSLPEPPPGNLPLSDSAKYNRAKAEQQIMSTERDRRAFEAEKGRYVLVDSVAPGFNRVLAGILASLEQSLPDIAKRVTTALGATDIKVATIAMRQAYRDWREQSSVLAEQEGLALPAFETDPERLDLAEQPSPQDLSA
jgi:hypothetical protein